MNRLKGLATLLTLLTVSILTSACGDGTNTQPPATGLTLTDIVGTYTGTAIEIITACPIDTTFTGETFLWDTAVNIRPQGRGTLVLTSEGESVLGNDTLQYSMDDIIFSQTSFTAVITLGPLNSIFRSNVTATENNKTLAFTFDTGDETCASAWSGSASTPIQQTEESF